MINKVNEEVNFPSRPTTIETTMILLKMKVKLWIWCKMNFDQSPSNKVYMIVCFKYTFEYFLLNKYPIGMNIGREINITIVNIPMS